MKVLHVCRDRSEPTVWIEPFLRELAKIGEFEMLEGAGKMTEAAVLERMRQADVLLGAWDSLRVPDALAASPGRVRYLCNVTGTLGPFLSQAMVASGIPVTNWGDSPANEIAEGAVCLLMAAMKDLHAWIRNTREGGGALGNVNYGGSLAGLNVGIYGFGVIGRRFAEMLQPFRCTMRVFDPFTKDFPSYVTPVASLDELFGSSQAIAIHAGLTPQTRKSVTRELLAKLPRHGIVVNTARGDIVDQDAIFDELRCGRLRAGLDVLAVPEMLPPDHPARKWENLIWTCHNIGIGWPTDGLPATKLHRMHEICLDNLRRFRDGQPLRFVMDPKRYSLST